MKVLGIVCSPRSHGNTELMLKASLESARQAGAEVDMLSLAGVKISPCDGCNSCSKSGKCHQKDEMQNIYPKLLEADGIIIASPVYYWNVTAQGKALIDRTCVFSQDKRLRGKVAGSIVTIEGSGGASAVGVLNGFFALHQMTIAGYAIGRSGAEGYSDKEAVRKDTRGMEQAKTLGEAVVRCLIMPKKLR